MAYEKAAKEGKLKEAIDPLNDPDNIIIDSKTGLDITKKENQHLLKKSQVKEKEPSQIRVESPREKPNFYNQNEIIETTRI